MPREKYDPIYRKMRDSEKKKRLEWAKKNGCYDEVKMMYEIQEKLKKHIVY